MSLRIYLYPQPNLLSLPHTLILDGKSMHSDTRAHTHTRLHKGKKKQLYGPQKWKSFFWLNKDDQMHTAM